MALAMVVFTLEGSSSELRRGSMLFTAAAAAVGCDHHLWQPLQAVVTDTAASVDCIYLLAFSPTTLILLFTQQHPSATQPHFFVAVQNKARVYTAIVVSSPL